MKKLDVVVIGGCGRVGLPLSLTLANQSLQVGIYDLNEDALRLARKGKMPFKEKGATAFLKKALKKRTLELSSSRTIIARAQTIIITIGTPIDGHLSHDMLSLRKALDFISPELKNGQLLILRSTIFPGTTKLVANLLKKKGKKIDVAYCPERIAEGRAMEELKKLPQIISGISPKAERRARTLFSKISDHLVTLSPMEAELAKLFINSWRYISFSISNQFYMLANHHGLDFYKIHHAMTYRYPRAKDFVLPGFTAGPCLLKDTMQLAAFASNQFFLGHSAMLVNEGLPDYIVRQLKKKTDLSKKTVGILGMAFKGGSDDIRDSLSVRLRKRLSYECKKVYCSDEYIKDSSYISPQKLIRTCDFVIIGAPHKKYAKLAYNNSKLIDVWNLTKRGRGVV